MELAKEIEFFRTALHLKESEVVELIERCLSEIDALLAEMSFPEQCRQGARPAAQSDRARPRSAFVGGHGGRKHAGMAAVPGRSAAVRGREDVVAW